MATPEDRIVSHYGTGGIFDKIVAALAANGIARDQIDAAHLRTIDEFHIGGAQATEALLDQIAPSKGSRILDIGSGIGGAARHMARTYGAQVTGVDLTPEYVATARQLAEILGTEVEFIVGSALDLPVGNGAFDIATLLHVGMNLPDKPRLFAEAFRALRPGGTFAVYDVMRFGAHPDFPLPWAGTPETSFLAAPETYLSAAADAGFALIARRDRGEVAKAFFAEMKAANERDGPPVVGPPLLMGADAPAKIGNMIASVGAGDIAPVEMIFRKEAS